MYLFCVLPLLCATRVRQAKRASWHRRTGTTAQVSGSGDGRSDTAAELFFYTGKRTRYSFKGVGGEPAGQEVCCSQRSRVDECDMFPDSGRPTENQRFFQVHSNVRIDAEEGRRSAHQFRGVLGALQ